MSALPNHSGLPENLVSYPHVRYPLQGEFNDSLRCEACYTVEQFGRKKTHRHLVQACAVEDWADPFDSPATFERIGEYLDAWAKSVDLDIRVEPGDHDTPPYLDYSCESAFVCLVEDHQTRESLELPDWHEVSRVSPDDVLADELLLSVELSVRLVYVDAFRRHFRAVIGDVI